MRLFLYALLPITLLILSVYFGQPIQKYLNTLTISSNGGSTASDLVHIDPHMITIRNVLTRLRTSNPSLARIRVAMIHTGVTNTGGIVWQWDTVAYVSKPSFAITGALVINQPLSQWSDYLPVLLNNHCAFMKTAAIKNKETKARLKAANIPAFIACPIMNPPNHLIGAVFGIWQQAADIPANMDFMDKSLQAAAITIGKKDPVN